MNLFIPELGSKIWLSKHWTFTVHWESRNKTLIESIMPGIYEEYEKAYSEWLDAYYRIRSEDKRELEALWKKVEKIKNKLNGNNFTFDPETILEVDRIYIRKGAEGFSSVTFKWRKDKKTIRFWVKLEDANRIIFELAGKNSFETKYPEGKFTLQRYHGHAIYWNYRNATTNLRFRGIGAELTNYKQSPDYNKIKIVNHQNNSFGNCTYYNSLEKMRKGAVKLGFPNELVNTFVENYTSNVKKF